MVNTRNNHCND
jgi:hypothetical protein